MRSVINGKLNERFATLFYIILYKSCIKLHSQLMKFIFNYFFTIILLLKLLLLKFGSSRSIVAGVLAPGNRTYFLVQKERRDSRVLVSDVAPRDKEILR